jgi:hypothetical protein
MNEYTQKYGDTVYIKMFETYNRVFSEAWQKYIDDQENGRGDQQSLSEAIYNNVHNSIQSWYKTALSADDGSVTGEDILAEIDDLGKAMKLAEYAAIYCDDEIPDIVKIKLNSFGGDPRRNVLDCIMSKNWEDKSVGQRIGDQQEEDPDPVIVASFIRLLGEWEYQDAIAPLVQHFVQHKQPAEIIADAMREYLKLFEALPVNDIITAINESLKSVNDLNAACEYLLIALTDIGKNHPNEQIFSTLKECFRKMSSKAIAAICLGDYGDGRAIPTLRGWLEKNPQLNDRQILYEIASAIQRLGGDISDLKPRLVANRNG